MRHSARNQFCKDSFSLRSRRRAPSPLLPPALREEERLLRRARGATGPPRGWRRLPPPAGALPERVEGGKELRCWPSGEPPLTTAGSSTSLFLTGHRAPQPELRPSLPLSSGLNSANLLILLHTNPKSHLLLLEPLSWMSQFATPFLLPAPPSPASPPTSILFDPSKYHRMSGALGITPFCRPSPAIVQ